MNNKHQVLFTPFNIGNLEIKNRFVLCSITGTALLSKGKFNSTVYDYYVERAKGGIGLIVSGCSVVYDMFGRGYWIDEYEEVFDGPIKKLVNEIHSYGAKFFMQIGAGLGRVVNVKTGRKIAGDNIDNVLFSSSELPNVFCPEVKHREIREDEIEKIIDSFVRTALLAQNAGIDGIEIHAVHEGYLLDQFAIKNTNHRKDKYGGSLENRLRFATEIIKGIKRECGEDFPISMRFGVESKMKGFNSGALPNEKYVEFGRTKEESVEVARLLIDAGVDVLNADNGSYDSWYWAHPPMYMPEACNLSEATFLKKMVNVPVICAGRMENPNIASAAIDNGQVDGIGIARQFLADPEYVNKIYNDEIAHILPCIACHNGCLGSLLEGKGVSCALRPATMHEREYQIKTSVKRKKIIVAGGGIGGMETARLASMRGHEVKLYESTAKLGGVFNAAAAPSFKEADRRLLKWYEREMAESSAEIILNTDVTEELLREENPDVLIVATGSLPRKLRIDGAYKEFVYEVRDVLNNGCNIKGDIIVVGGGLSGCEVAYELAKKGSKVTIIEMTDEILRAPMLSMANSIMLKDLLVYYDVNVITSATLKSIKERYIEIETLKGTKQIKADNIVISAGSISDVSKMTVDDSLAKIKMIVPEVYKVGDVESIGSLLNVIKSAYNIALDL